MLIPSSLSSLPWWPFVIVIVCIIFIVIAIVRFKMHAMIALLLAALLAGLLTGKPSWQIVDKNGVSKEYGGLLGTIELTSKGFGDTAREVAISIALASIIGMSLMQSGAADKVVRRFLAVFGEKNAGWALLWSTYILSIPIFFDTMFMLMAPLAKALGNRTGKDYMLYAMCVACGGVITHSMTIPHPGPLAVVDELKLDSGVSLIAGLLSGIVPAIVGYFVCVAINKRLPVQPRLESSSSGATAIPHQDVPESELPSFFWSLAPVLFPIFLISLSSFAQVIQDGATKTPVTNWCVTLYNLFDVETFKLVRDYISFVGHKNIALLIGAFLSLGLLMRRCKLSFEEIDRRVGPTLETAGMIILITSAGGAFGGMLRAIGVGEALKDSASSGSVNLLLLSWVIAIIVRLAQGSATVAMQTTVALAFPMLDQLDCHPLYLYLAIGWGAMGGSWMNDSGFWVVSRLGGFTQKQTLQSWTILLLCLSFVGITTTYVVSRLMPLV